MENIKHAYSHLQEAARLLNSSKISKTEFVKAAVLKITLVQKDLLTFGLNPPPIRSKKHEETEEED